MKTNSLLLVIAMILLNGCAIFAIGAGAAGGYAISKDEVEGFSDKKIDQLWDFGWEVLNQKGAVELADKETGKIEALVEGSKVKYELEQVSGKSVRIRIQARKAMNLFPDIDLAQSLYNQIMKKAV